MNSSKYDRLYPERAVKPLREIVAKLLETEEVMEGAAQDCQEALDALDSLGFPPDEPLFLLRGQDVLAGEMVHCYAQTVRDHPDSHMRTAMDANHIDDHADLMDLWTPRKLPD